MNYFLIGGLVIFGLVLKNNFKKGGVVSNFSGCSSAN